MKYITLVILVFLISCDKNQYVDIEKEINDLETQADKEEYLLNLFKKDQAVRDSDEAYEIKKRTDFDENAEEYRNYLKKMSQTDSLNFEKVKLFIQTHGFPEIENKNSLAYAAIPTIMLHQGLENNRSFFPHLYNAYLDKKLTSEDLSTILNRMYSFQFGRRHQINGTSTIDTNIEVLIKEMELTTD